MKPKLPKAQPSYDTISMHPIEKITLGYLAFFLILGIYLAIFNQSYFDSVYTLEDGILEWLTVIALFTTAWVCCKRAIQFSATQKKQFIVMNLLFAGIFFFAAGEEISWGQRLFDWQTNEYFTQFNAQNETNLHNLKVNGIKINQLIFGLGFSIILLTYLLVLAPLYNINSKVHKFLDQWGIPMPKNLHIIGYFVILIAVEVIIKELSETGRRGELTEFVTSFWVLLNVTFPKNTLFYQTSIEIEP